MSKALDLIEEYLSVGGLFNPEIMNQMQHDAVRDTLIIARDEIRGLEKRIKQRDEWNERLDERIDRLTEKIILLNEIRQEAGVENASLREKLSAANERIKLLDETLEGITNKLDAAWGIYMQFKEPKP